MLLPCIVHYIGSVSILPNVKSKVMRRVLQKVKLEPLTDQFVYLSKDNDGIPSTYVPLPVYKMSPPVHHHHDLSPSPPLTATPHRPSRLTEQYALTQTLKDLSNTSLGPSRPLDFSYSCPPPLVRALPNLSLPPPRPPRPRPAPRPSNTGTAPLSQTTPTVSMTA